MESAPTASSFTDRDGSSVRAAVDRLRYRAQHYGLTLSLAIPGHLLNLVLAPRQERVDAAVLAALQRRSDALLERDLDNVGRGDYPRELLYQFPLLGYLRQIPEALVDLPRFFLRSYLADSGELAPLLRGFAATYHEPYYKGYLRDDLAAVMVESGFEVELSEPHLFSKVVVGRKPHRPRARRDAGMKGNA